MDAYGSNSRVLDRSQYIVIDKFKGTSKMAVVGTLSSLLLNLHRLYDCGVDL